MKEGITQVKVFRATGKFNLPPPQLDETVSHPPQGQVPIIPINYTNQSFFTNSKSIEAKKTFNPTNSIQPKLNSALQFLANDLITKERAKIEKQIREIQENTLKIKGDIAKYQMIFQQ